MFQRFKDFFNVEDIFKNTPYDVELTLDVPEDVKEFLYKYEGMTFGEGLYRIHKLEEIEKWNKIVTDVYTEFQGWVHCFGYDWLGRQFAINFKSTSNNRPLILMFEPGTADVLEIPCNFVDFHEEEITEYHDACLASSFFKQWVTEVDNNALESSKCVGYKIPLFLGGEDNISNLELSDMEVYWSIYSELITKTK